MNFARILVACAWLGWAATAPAAQTAETNAYVGSKACAECHAKEYETFTRFAKKAHSFKSVQIMAPKLAAEEIRECYGCHTTGYGRPGGFKSYEETPHLAEAGCEVCHGPGQAHAASADPTLVRRTLTIKDCETCHNAERVASFNYKPLLFGGAH